VGKNCFLIYVSFSVDPAFHEFLISNQSDNFFFCFRWLLCQFKREYSFQDTMRLWEVMWTDVCAPKFDLFIVFVTILKLRNKILIEEMSFDEILKHCNDMSGRNSRF
jgi:TBC1 domain family member 15